MIFVDTNILVYSVDKKSPKNIKAQQFLYSNYRKLAISHQCVMEFIRVVTHKSNPNPLTLEQAVAAIGIIVSRCRLITPNELSFQLAIELIQKYNSGGKRVFDIYLAATSLSLGINTIATDNTKHFKMMTEIKTLNPFV